MTFPEVKTISVYLSIRDVPISFDENVVKAKLCEVFKNIPELEPYKIVVKLLTY